MHKPLPRLVFLSIIISLLTALFLYLEVFQTPILSKREFAITALLWVAITLLVYLLLSRFLIPRLYEYTPRSQRNWLLISLAFGLFFALVNRPPQLILLLPKHTLQILIPAGLPDRSITLEWASTALGGDISFSQFSTSGDWQRTESGFSFSGSKPASLSWSGRSGDSASMVFSDSPALAGIQTGWDGNLSSIDTSQASNGQVPLSVSFPTPWLTATAAFLLVGFTAGFLFLVITIFLVSLELKPAQPVKHKKGYWLLFALPMIAVWILFLLIFFPGLASQDSVLQWQQVLTGQYTDHHPLLYTLLIGLVSRIYYSPASVVITQVLMVSLALAWGLAEVERMGVSRKVLWVLSVLFAMLPVNILTTITLRKDVLYSAALLILSIIFLKIINSRGDWLILPWHWVGLGFTMGVIGLTRINGIPVAIGSVLLILIIYRSAWRQVAAAAGVFVLSMVVIYGPVSSVLKVKHEPEFGAQLPLHHIAAHLQAGTPLTPEEQDYLSKLAPLDGWNYDCCLVNSTSIAIFPGINEQIFDLPQLKQDIQKPTRLAVSLFLKNPLVDLKHMICAGQQVWSLQSSCPDRIITSLRSPQFIANYPNSYYFFPENQMGFQTNSILPFLIGFSNPYLQVFSKGLIHKVNYTTAIYLYLTIYCTALLSFRKKDRFFLLFLAPPLFQSIALFLVNMSQTYRYQYGVELMGMLSIGFLFVPLVRKRLAGIAQIRSDFSE